MTVTTTTRMSFEVTSTIDAACLRRAGIHGELRVVIDRARLVIRKDRRGDDQVVTDRIMGCIRFGTVRIDA